jgi:hypothetical protein
VGLRRNLILELLQVCRGAPLVYLHCSGRSADLIIAFLCMDPVQSFSTTMLFDSHRDYCWRCLRESRRTRSTRRYGPTHVAHLIVYVRRHHSTCILRRFFMLFACIHASSQADGEHDTTHDGSKLDKKAATAQAIAAEENIRRVERWRYVQPFFPFVRKWTSFFLNTLKCMKSAALRLKYNDLGDFIYKMGILDVTFGRYMQRSWTHQVGYVRERFTQFSQAYVKQMSELHLKLKTFLEVSD